MIGTPRRAIADAGSRHHIAASCDTSAPDLGVTDVEIRGLEGVIGTVDDADIGKLSDGRHRRARSVVRVLPMDWAGCLPTAWRLPWPLIPTHGWLGYGASPRPTETALH